MLASFLVAIGDLLAVFLPAALTVPAQPADSYRMARI